MHARRGPTSSIGRLALFVTRAVGRRCPNCGSGGVFAGYLRQASTCPGCGLLLDRGQKDFFIGAYTINLIAAELLVVFGGVIAVFATWPAVPWNTIMLLFVGVMLAGPILLYPLSRQLWLALDLFFQPPAEDDFAAPILPSPPASNPH
jgi:uncharacterized protein (DUF983 family)